VKTSSPATGRCSLVLWLWIASMGGAGSVAGCASSGGAESGRETGAEAAEEPSTSRETPERYGDDPMGVAQRWADDPPEAPASGGAEAAELLEDWERVSVLRVSRRGAGSYRAVLARSGSGDGAVLLVVERREGGWEVVRAERGSPKFLWPEM